MGLLNGGRAGKKATQKVAALLATMGSNLVYCLCAEFRLKLLILFCKREKNGKNLVKEKNVNENDPLTCERWDGMKEGGWSGEAGAAAGGGTAGAARLSPACSD